MATVSVNGRSIGYEESGYGDPLILIHGGQSDRHQFDLFRPLLGDRIRAIAYDQRDTRENIYEGESPYTIYDLAQDCVDFLAAMRSEEHTSELQSLMRISYAVFCLKKKKNQKHR